MVKAICFYHLKRVKVVCWVFFVFLLQALGLKRDDTFSVTMLGHCIEMYIGDTDAYIGWFQFWKIASNFLCLI